MISRSIEISNDREVEIIQDLNFGYAGEVWDAALVLSHFFINKNKKHNFMVENKIILELGAGTGICGLICAVLGAKNVILTDKSENLGILEKNYELNKNQVDNCQVGILSLDWNNEEDFKKIKEKVELIVCSDLVWNPDYFDPLINTLDYFTSVYNSQIILCYQYRKKTDLDFFEKLKKKGFLLQRLNEEYFDEEYKSEDIFIVFISKQN